MDWAFVQKSWEKWASSNIGSSGNLSQSFHYILFYLLICDWGLRCKLQAVTANLACSKIAGQPLKAALLINYDPLRPSRLLSTMTVYDDLPDRAEQEGIKISPIELSQFVNFIKRNKLQKETFMIGNNQCLNTSKSAGEGAIVMQASVFLLVALGILVVKASVFVRYDGSIGLASRAMASVDQLVWQLNRKNL
ncbi:hypothetical protein Goarm_011577 [Gossypium armourianum]|uniref:Uncharacterized protein n=1 Tax=Gossypium armourianum TaxID=34283 RepID=A0A7J9IYU1_9ROSI|nr:hypothetical protein [Gossypium armourianum]